MANLAYKAKEDLERAAVAIGRARVSIDQFAALGYGDPDEAPYLERQVRKLEDELGELITSVEDFA